MRQQKSVFQNIDWMLVWLYILMVGIGWINIYAAVYNENHSSILDISQNYGKQLIWISAAAVVAFTILLIDARFFEFFAYWIYVLVILLLVVVLVLARRVSGAASWLDIGAFKLQPAEFAKFAVSLAMAKYLSQLSSKMELIRTKFVSIIILALPMALILLQNDTGSALVFGCFILVLYREGLSGTYLFLGLLIAVMFVLSLLFTQKAFMIGLASVMLFAMLLYRKNKKMLLVLLGVGFICFAVNFSVGYVFDHVLEPHQKTRINVLLGKETDLKGSGYNVNQSKIAIGSGGFIGKGFLQGTQTKYDFVPEQSTDFIFCTVGEEWGFVGSMVTVALFIALLIRIVNKADRQRSSFSRIYGYCVASILFFHFMINIGMTIGLLPVIGIPLPFFSYGGSSLLAFTILLFIFIKQDSYRLMILR